MTSVLENDTLEGLPSMGTQLGEFMGNLAPGLGKFILILGIFVGIAAIILGIVVVIKKSTGHRKI